MKRRLFAAAMAMTMVMVTGIPVMALDKTNLSDTKESESLAVDATVTGNTNRENKTAVVVNDDATKYVWLVDITVDSSMNYNLTKTTTANYTGNDTWTWNGTNYVHTASPVNSSTTYGYAFTDSNDDGIRKFKIVNHSNFPITGVEYSDSENLVGAALTLPDDIDTSIASNDDSGWQEVSLDPSIITRDLTYSDDSYSANDVTKIATISMEFTPGVKLTHD